MYGRICGTTDQLSDFWDGIVSDRVGYPIDFGPLGEVLDSGVGRPGHGLIPMNLGREAGNGLKDGPCQVLDASVQVRLGGQRKNVHADVTVCCDELQMDPGQSFGPVIFNPRLAFEVLSPTTEP